MKEKINDKVKNYSLAVLIALMGLVMLIWPEFCIKIVVVISGLAVIVNGIFTLKNYYNFVDDSGYKKSLLIKCILSIVIGLVAVLFPFILMKSVAAIWTIITYVLAVFFIVYSIISIFSVSLLKDVEADFKRRVISESIIYLLIAVILFVIPVGSVIATIFRVAGIVALVVSALMITREIFYSKKMNSVKNS